MKNVMIGLIIVALVVVLVGGQVSGNYNKLVRFNEDINGRWAQVENQLQRRADLIPNLVSVVKGYAAHETQIFLGIAEARAKLAGAKNAPLQEQISAANQFDSALARLLVIVEQYPQLKADAQYTGLRDELTGTENRIAVERMRYNESVKTYNETVKQFPMVLFARMLGFQDKPYYQIPAAAKDAPKVNF